MDSEQIYTFEVLNGPTYTQDDRPEFWRNEKSLVLGFFPDWSLVPFSDFPLIEDFEVRLERLRVNGEIWKGYGLYFFSSSYGYIAGFPWWDLLEQHLVREDFQSPLSDFTKPYRDFDQGWQIIIVAEDDIVYVLQCDDEEYYAWFKVDKIRYLAEWQKAIDLCRATFLK